MKMLSTTAEELKSGPLPLPQLDARKNELVRLEDMRYLDKIRDQFAMAAITGILATDPVGVTPDTLAHNSYVIAGCMMEARKK